MGSEFFDLELLKTKLPGIELDWSARVASTNDRGLELARGGAAAPHLVLADEQTAGRGRGENQWWSSDGSLTFSLLLDAEAIGLELEAWPVASLAVGLAVCQALEGSAAGAPLALKWPNDVYLDERKLSGVLVETSPTPPRLVIGVGINVNNAFESAPPELRRQSISLRDFYGRSFELTEILIQTVRTILAQVRNSAQNRPGALRAWRERCLLTGREVEIESGNRTIVGECRGIDDQGALLVQQTSGAEERIVAGVIRRFH